ncbi:hypothetical protein HDV01_002275, partial [Terramyces sp. JEL0728]
AGLGTDVNTWPALLKKVGNTSMDYSNYSKRKRSESEEVYNPYPELFNLPDKQRSRTQSSPERIQKNPAPGKHNLIVVAQKQYVFLNAHIRPRVPKEGPSLQKIAIMQSYKQKTQEQSKKRFEMAFRASRASDNSPPATMPVMHPPQQNLQIQPQLKPAENIPKEAPRKSKKSKSDPSLLDFSNDDTDIFGYRIRPASANFQYVSPLLCNPFVVAEENRKLSPQPPQALQAVKDSIGKVTDEPPNQHSINVRKILKSWKYETSSFEPVSKKTPISPTANEKKIPIIPASMAKLVPRSNTPISAMADLAIAKDYIDWKTDVSNYFSRPVNSLSQGYKLDLSALREGRYSIGAGQDCDRKLSNTDNGCPSCPPIIGHVTSKGKLETKILTLDSSHGREGVFYDLEYDGESYDLCQNLKMKVALDNTLRIYDITKPTFTKVLQGPPDMFLDYDDSLVCIGEVNNAKQLVIKIKGEDMVLNLHYAEIWSMYELFYIDPLALKQRMYPLRYLQLQHYEGNKYILNFNFSLPMFELLESNPFQNVIKKQMFGGVNPLYF